MISDTKSPVRRHEIRGWAHVFREGRGNKTSGGRKNKDYPREKKEWSGGKSDKGRQNDRNGFEIIVIDAYQIQIEIEIQMQMQMVLILSPIMRSISIAGCSDLQHGSLSAAVL